MFKTSWTRFRSRFKAKRPFSLTRPGWVFILYTIGLGAGAINTGNNLLYLMFGLFLGMIMASGVLSDLSLWGLKATLSAPAIAVAGRPVALAVRLVNHKKWWPSLSVRLRLEADLNGQPVSLDLFVPFVSSSGVYQGQFFWTPPQRGVFMTRRVVLSTRFPFGLLLKWWIPVDELHETLVSPMRRPLSFDLDVALGSGQKNMRPRDERGDSSVMRSLRAYRPEDNVRRVHWKASAKRDSVGDGSAVSWLMKEMEAEQQPLVQLDWPDEDRAAMSADELDRLASLVASVVDEGERRGRAFALRVGPFLLTSYHSLMAYLALVGPFHTDRVQQLLARYRAPQWQRGVDVRLL